MTEEQFKSENAENVNTVFLANNLEIQHAAEEFPPLNVKDGANVIATLLLIAAGRRNLLNEDAVSDMQLFDSENLTFSAPDDYLSEDIDEVDDVTGTDTLPIDSLATLETYLSKIEWDNTPVAKTVIDLLKQANSSRKQPSQDLQDLQEIGVAIGLKGPDANNLECIKIRLKELVDTERNAFTPDVLQSFGAIVGVKGRADLERFEKKLKEIMEKSITPDELATVLGIRFTGSCTKETILSTVQSKLEETVSKPTSDSSYLYETIVDKVITTLDLARRLRTTRADIPTVIVKEIQQLKEAAANTSQENCNQALLEKINNQLGMLGSSVADEEHVVAAVRHNYELYMRTWKGLQDIGRTLCIHHTGITVADILAEIAKREDLAIARPDDREVVQAVEKPSQATVNSAQPNFLQTLMLLELMFGGKKKKKA